MFSEQVSQKAAGRGAAIHKAPGVSEGDSPSIRGHRQLHKFCTIDYEKSAAKLTPGDRGEIKVWRRWDSRLQKQKGPE